MSQKKVLEYKESKRNRKEIIKKQKRQAMIGKAIAGVAAVAIVAVIGFVFINNASSKGNGTDANNVNVSSINDYVGTLEMDQAMAVFDDEATDSAVDVEESE